jgi:hypothetical protein
MTLEKQTQLYIMNIVFGIEDLQKLNILKGQVEDLVEEPVEIPDFMEAVETTRNHIPLQEIYTIQNHEKINFDEYMEQVKTFDWGDVTLEELLAELKE